MKAQITSKKPNKIRPFLLHRVTGSGMLPVLKPSQLVFAMSRRQYQDEDVVVIWHNGMEKIERVRTVQGNRFEVRGDNPSRSTDSRQFGLIEKQAILGKVIWPRV